HIACLPSKNLIYAARVASLARRGAEFGLETNSLTVSMKGVQRRKRLMVDGLHQMHVARTVASGVELIMGEGRFVAPTTVEISLNDGGSRRIFGERVFLVLGSRATMPEVPGIHRVWCRGERVDGRRPNRDGRADALYDVARCDVRSPDSIGGAGLFARSRRTP